MVFNLERLIFLVRKSQWGKRSHKKWTTMLKGRPMKGLGTSLATEALMRAWEAFSMELVY